MGLTILHKQIEYLFSPRSAPNWSTLFMNERLIHKKSESSKRPDDHIDLEIDGERVGRAKIRYYETPFPLYLINDMTVKTSERDKGYASKIMGRLESMLSEQNLAGVLVNIIPEESGARDMYKNRGWVRIPDTKDGYAFNVPQGRKVEELKSFIA